MSKVGEPPGVFPWASFFTRCQWRDLAGRHPELAETPIFIHSALILWYEYSEGVGPKAPNQPNKQVPWKPGGS